MSLFPAFLKLQGRLAVVVGGGSLAEQKIPGLLQAGARVRVVAPCISARVGEWVRDNTVEWRAKGFAGEDLLGAFLVVAATALKDLNADVFQEAEKRNILCNAVDDIENCHFYYGSVVQRGDLQIAISTNGKSPALAQRLRKELEGQFGAEYAAWVEWLGAAREVLRAQAGNAESTKRWLHILASRPMFEKFLKQAGQDGQQGAV
jgi:precorrin-2 dehydrogenase/sirohydrochlorin ferrochelatase